MPEHKHKTEITAAACIAKRERIEALPERIDWKNSDVRKRLLAMRDQGLTLRAIGLELGVSATTIRWRLRRAQARRALEIWK